MGKESVESYCISKDWNIIKTYHVEAISRKVVFNHPTMNEMFEDIKSNDNTDENYTLIVSVVDALGVSETKSLDRAAPKKGVMLQIKTEEHTVSVMVL